MNMTLRNALITGLAFGFFWAAGEDAWYALTGLVGVCRG